MQIYYWNSNVKRELVKSCDIEFQQLEFQQLELESSFHFKQIRNLQSTDILNNTMFFVNDSTKY